MFGSVNQSCYNCFRWGPKTQTYRAHWLLYGKVGHSTVLTLNAYCLPHGHIFKLTNVLSWIPFGSDLDPNRVYKWRERERERERLVQAHQSKHSIGGSTIRERERERDRDVCVFFLNFVSFILLWELVYVFQSLCRSLQKIWSYEMSSGFNSWVQY